MSARDRMASSDISVAYTLGASTVPIGSTIDIASTSEADNVDVIVHVNILLAISEYVGL